MSAYFGSDVPKLGFGMMRLPRKLAAIDIEETERMVDAFLAAGFTYFDTAHIYPGSEVATRKALVERYPRERFTLATKLYAPLARTERGARQQLDTSLEKLGTSYVDYYLLHSLNRTNYRKYEKMRLWDFVQEKKAEGVIRHVGFSFHDTPDVLDRILDDHPEVEFVQLQINYADWENPKVASRGNYETARAHSVSIVVMEPLKGGQDRRSPGQREADLRRNGVAGQLRVLGDSVRSRARRRDLRSFGHEHDGAGGRQRFLHARLPPARRRRTRRRAEGPSRLQRLADHPMHRMRVLPAPLPPADRHPRHLRRHEPAPGRRPHRSVRGRLRRRRRARRPGDELHRLRSLRARLHPEPADYRPARPLRQDLRSLNEVDPRARRPRRYGKSSPSQPLHVCASAP
jgi:aryl-alcohol dehydrogenase-like predicted oxidoreductase